jgi:exodeoxyribonuclease VII small subunit
MNFEESLAELEAIVKKLESDAALDESIKLFERGIKLSKACIEDLKVQRGRIALLTDEVNNLTEELKIE